jgi:hypothetical protein
MKKASSRHQDIRASQEKEESVKGRTESIEAEERNQKIPAPLLTTPLSSAGFLHLGTNSDEPSVQSWTITTQQ